MQIKLSGFEEDLAIRIAPIRQRQMHMPSLEIRRLAKRKQHSALFGNQRKRTAAGEGAADLEPPPPPHADSTKSKGTAPANKIARMRSSKAAK